LRSLFGRGLNREDSRPGDEGGDGRRLAKARQ